MEGRRRVGREDGKDSGKLCSVKGNTSPSPEIFTEVPHTHEMFNGSVSVCV